MLTQVRASSSNMGDKIRVLHLWAHNSSGNVRPRSGCYMPQTWLYAHVPLNAGRGHQIRERRQLQNPNKTQHNKTCAWTCWADLSLLLMPNISNRKYIHTFKNAKCRLYVTTGGRYVSSVKTHKSLNIFYRFYFVHTIMTSWSKFITAAVWSV